MRNNLILPVVIIVLLISCKSPGKKPELDDATAKQVVTKVDGAESFEQKMYYKIDKIYSGPVFEDENSSYVFYRILEVPEEENVSLYAEKISIGDESGNYQLIKRIRLTDDKAVLPKFGLGKIDSLKFTDSVTVSGYFNDKRQSINLSKLK